MGAPRCGSLYHSVSQGCFPSIESIISPVETRILTLHPMAKQIIDRRFRLQEQVSHGLYSPFILYKLLSGPIFRVHNFMQGVIA